MRFSFDKNARGGKSPTDALSLEREQSSHYEPENT